jgi:enamine deaminase RidA (YjgF/YER057c/UK114 family)
VEDEEVHMATRKTLTIQGIDYSANGIHPIPMGARLGNLVVSSILTGTDPDTRELPPDVEGQARILFRNIRALMEDAGGTVNNIARVSFFVQSKRDHRPPIDEEWTKMFPEGGYRPARIVLEVSPQGTPLIQAELIGLLESDDD